MGGSMFALRSKQLGVIALCASAALLSSTAFADNDKHRGERSHWGQGRDHDRGDHDRRDHDRGDNDRRDHDRWDGRRDHDRWDGRRNDGQRGWRDDDNHRGRDWDRRSNWRGDDRRYYDNRYRAPDWRYYNGRYWAPADYRGRYCDDRRHYHGVHYHVAARDYYDYYYPRYRYYGSQPYGANASVIISIPLF
jgi:hypothetical protein